jgi:hypothetical protein
MLPLPANIGVSRGYRCIMYPGADVYDAAPRFQSAYPNASFALIAARAFVGMRALDYGLHHMASRVEPAQVSVSGHSRNGKQSLVLAAFDERVTAVVGSSPGAPVIPHRLPILPSRVALTQTDAIPPEF